MSSGSITRRTIATVLIAQVAFALALSSAMVWHAWRARMHALDVQIAGHADSLRGATQDAEDPEDNLTLDPQELQLPAEDRYAVYLEGGKLVGRSARGSPLARTGALGVSSAVIDGRHYRVLRRRGLRIVDRDENSGQGLRRPILIVYAAPMSHVLEETFQAVGFSLLWTVVLAAMTALLMTWLLRTTLRPIRDLSLAAQRVSSSALEFNPPESAMRVDELRPLALTLTLLIQDLRDAFAKEQRFVGDAAHELKTAVAVVRSSLQVLMMRPRRAEEYAEGLGRLLQDNERVEDLVARMLELARLEQRGAADAPLLDLAGAAVAACRTMASMAEVRGVQLDVENRATGALVRLPATDAEALLTNLLSNAIRHSAAAGRVTVTVAKAAEGTMLTVEDHGSGIRAEAMPHIFERFYRDDPSRSRLSGGTGLGLAVCKSIVEAAGGSIRVESTLGEGTRAIVFFRDL